MLMVDPRCAIPAADGATAPAHDWAYGGLRVGFFFCRRCLALFAASDLPRVRELLLEGALVTAEPTRPAR